MNAKNYRGKITNLEAYCLCSSAMENMPADELIWNAQIVGEYLDRTRANGFMIAGLAFGAGVALGKRIEREKRQKHK